MIRVFLFDQDHNVILLSKNVEFSHFIDAEYMELVDENLIGSEMIVRVVKHAHEHEVVHAHKTVFKAALKAIKTTQTEKYKVDSNKLKEEKEITITGPVQIAHPTASILLPFVKTYEGSLVGEMWQMSAYGGSDTYVWSSLDPNVARMADRARLWSMNVG